MDEGDEQVGSFFTYLLFLSLPFASWSPIV